MRPCLWVGEAFAGKALDQLIRVRPSRPITSDTPAERNPQIPARTALEPDFYRQLRTGFSQRLRSLADSLTTGILQPGQFTSGQVHTFGTEVIKHVPSTDGDGRAYIGKTEGEIRDQLSKMYLSAQETQNQMLALQRDMDQLDDWSEKDAQRRLIEWQGRLVQQQSAAQEVTAFPDLQWPKFVLGVATTFFGLGSAVLGVERITGSLPSADTSGFWSLIAVVVPYAVGAGLAFVSLRAMTKNDDDKRTTYHKLFGGKKY